MDNTPTDVSSVFHILTITVLDHVEEHHQLENKHNKWQKTMYDNYINAVEENVFHEKVNEN